MEVSLFASAFGTRPRRATWSGLELTRPVAVQSDDKRLAPAWSPATYPPGATRGGEHVESVTALVLDVDDGTALDVVWGLWPAAARVLHTSWSHTAEHPKCRLVVPLANPVPAEGWLRVWTWASVHASRRGVKADPSCKDPCRLFFLPVDRGVFEAREALDLPALEVDWTRLVDPRAAQRRRAPLILPKGAPRPVGRRFERPEERLELAHQLGAAVRGVDPRAVRVRCPACGRASVYYYVRPYKMHGARCDHERSCGWRGGLGALCR